MDVIAHRGLASFSPVVLQFPLQLRTFLASCKVLRTVAPAEWSLDSGLTTPLGGLFTFLSSGYLKKKKNKKQNPPFLIKIAGWVLSKALSSPSGLIPLVGKIILSPWNSGFKTTWTVPVLLLLVRRSIRPQEPRHVGTSSSSLLLSQPNSLLGRSQTQLVWSQSFRI